MSRPCTLYIGKKTYIGRLRMGVTGHVFVFEDGSGDKIYFSNCQIWNDGGPHIEAVGECVMEQLK